MGDPATLICALAHDVFGELDGVGIDIVSVQLLTDLIADGGQPFLDASWSPAEQSDSNNDPERLAARWAAKEAVMKCLGTGIGEVEPTDVEIVTLSSGAPQVALRGRAARLAQSRGLSAWRISMSHEAGWAAAIAVGLRISAPMSPRPGIESNEGDVSV